MIKEVSCQHCKKTGMNDDMYKNNDKVGGYSCRECFIEGWAETIIELVYDRSYVDNSEPECPVIQGDEHCEKDVTENLEEMLKEAGLV